MKRKRILVFFLLVLAGSFLLLGCDNNEKEVKKDDTFTLTLNIVGDGFVVDLKEGDNKIEKRAIVELEARPGSGYGFCFWEGDIKEEDKYKTQTNIHLTENMKVTVFFTNFRVPQNYETIQGAVNAAKDNDIILVSAGTYFEIVDLKEKEIILQSTNPHSKEIVDSTIIDGSQSEENKAIITINSTDATITGFTIRGGKQRGIEVSTAAPIISYNRVINNSANEGSAIHLTAAHKTNIVNNRIEMNTTNLRGAIYALVCDDMNIINNTFKNNTATNGAAIFIHSSKDILIKENTFEKNKSTESGGAIFLERCEADIEDNTFKENEGKNGGAIFLKSSGGRIFNSNSFQNNKALINGGGLFLSENSKPEIFNNNIFLNQATEGLGGGIFISQNSNPKDNKGNNWVRANFQPTTEKHNTYIENSHGGAASNNGNHVFFEENK